MQGKFEIKPGPNWVDVDVGCHSVRMTPVEAMLCGAELVEAGGQVIAPTEPSKIEAVHILLHGLPLCKFTGLPPAHWPIGHRWAGPNEAEAREHPKACQACLAEIAAMETGD